jgi:hypothetical protein
MSCAVVIGGGFDEPHEAAAAPITVTTLARHGPTAVRNRISDLKRLCSSSTI